MLEHSKNNMMLTKLAVLGLLVSLSGCTQEEEAPAASPTTEVAPEEVKPEQAEPAEPEPAAEPAANAAEQQPTLVENVGLATPESALYLTDEDALLVSNVNGAPTEVDGNGFISRFDPQGKLEQLKWIDGAQEGVTLNAPKGMAIAAGVLYVADLDTVRKFDAKSGAPKGEVAIKGATFLNDIAAADDGTVYVSDSGLKAGAEGLEGSGSDAVYKISGDKAEPLAKGKELGRPNGLLLDGEDLWVASYASNELYKLSDGKKSDVMTLPKGALDGLAKTGDGKLVVSSWEGSQVFIGTPGGEFTALVSGAAAPADIGYDSKRNTIVIPRFNDHALQFVSVEQATAEAVAPAAPAAAEGKAAEQAKTQLPQPAAE